MSYIVTEGNATSDVDLRFTKSDTPKQVAIVSIAVNDRSRNAEREWSGGGTTYYEVTVWGAPAETFAMSVTNGTRIIVAGDLAAEEYTDTAGNTRTRRRVTAEHVGLSPRFVQVTAAQCTKPARDPRGGPSARRCGSRSLSRYKPSA